MPETLKTVLHALLLDRYADFRKRLTYRLGSEEQASDALQETYLRVDGMKAAPAIRHPAAYLMRMAENIAVDQYRSDGRTLGEADITALMDMTDETADPERIASGRIDLAELESALGELPHRRRTILVLARVEGMLHRDIATLFRISRRTVERELELALTHCSERLGRPAFQQRGAAPYELGED